MASKLKKQTPPPTHDVEILDAEFTQDEAAEERAELYEVRATVDGWRERGLDY